MSTILRLSGPISPGAIASYCPGDPIYESVQEADLARAFQRGDLLNNYLFA